MKPHQPKNQAMTLHTQAPDWSYEETRDKIMDLPNGWIQELTTFLYTTGGRINEGRFIRPKDVSIMNTRFGKRVLVRIPAEKNPHIEYRNIPINPYPYPNGELHYTKIVLAWRKKYWNEQDQLLFHAYTERWYRMQLRELLDIHPHALRHLRVHHIDDKSVPGMQSLTPRQYQDYFGWETISTSSKYQSRTRSRDLAEQF